MSDFFRGPDEVYVPLLLLNVKPLTLAHVITTLVERHGSEVVPFDRPF